VYQLLDPTLIDGSTMSPNMSCATGVPPRNFQSNQPLPAPLTYQSDANCLPIKAADYSQLKNWEST
jgi:hypothetical protein